MCGLTNVDFRTKGDSASVDRYNPSLKYTDMGTVVIGKVESGECEKGQTLAIYPNRTEVKVDQMWSDDIEVTKVGCGENVKVKVKGVEESEITPGFVLCDPTNPIKSCKTFDAQVISREIDVFCGNNVFTLHSVEKSGFFHHLYFT